MDRIRHIDTRNLVVCETFDDFAKKVEQCDQDVEDIVGYVTSVSRVFYWLNVESVWGVIGFNWEPTSLSDLEGYPNPWERLEHVIAEGNNIDGEHGELTPEGERQMEEALKRREGTIKKGYGYFARTTIPFDIIPKLPDGYRITEFRNTFDNIASNDIELQRSDWDNVTRVQYVAPVGKHVSMDLTDAPITYFEPWIGGNDTGKMLYIKANLENSTWKFNSNGFSNSLPRGVLEVDDKNIGLNINLANAHVANTPNNINIHYVGDTEFKDSNYLINFENISLYGNCYVYADTKKLKIHQLNTKVYNSTLYNYGLSLANRLQLDSSINANSLRPKDEEDWDLTINTDYCANINMAYILGLINYSTTDWTPHSSTTVSTRFKLLPIKYEGTFESIDMYNPYCSIYNGFPAIDYAVTNKIVNSGAGQFMPYLVFYSYKSCPYTLNLSNYTYYSIFDGFQYSSATDSGISELESVHIQNSDSDFRIYKNGLPVLTGTDHTFTRFTFPRNNTQSGVGFVFELPSIKSDTIYMQNGYIRNGVKIECSKLYGNTTVTSRALFVENQNTPSFKIYPENGSMYFRTPVWAVSGNNVNYVEFTSLDTEILRNSTINTLPIAQVVPNDGAYVQPYILSNLDSPTESSAPNYHAIDSSYWNDSMTFNPSFIFIYRTHISFGNNDYGPFTDKNNVSRIIDALEPLVNENEYNKFWVSMPRSYLNKYDDDGAYIINRIENVCHYHLRINESI